VPAVGSKAAAIAQVRDNGKVRLCGMADTVPQGSYEHLETYSGTGLIEDVAPPALLSRLHAHVAPSATDAGSGHLIDRGHLEKMECDCCGRVGVRLFQFGAFLEDDDCANACADCFEDVMGYDPR